MTGVRGTREEARAELGRREFLSFVRYTKANYRVDPVHRFVADRLQRFMEAIERGESPRLMLFMPPQEGKPLYNQSMILLGDGSYTTLEHVKVGDTVITHRGRARRVNAVHEQGDLPCVRITTHNGRQTIAALDHPFLTPTGWVKAGDLRPGMVLANVAQPDTRHHTDAAPAEAFRLAGYFLGDGSTTFVGKGTGINAKITAYDEAEREDIRQCARELGFGLGRENAKDIPLTGGARAWLRDIGYAGKGSATKRVPEFVYRGTPEQIGHFVGAYFQCDGTVTRRGKGRTGAERTDLVIEFYSVNAPLLQDIQRLLLRLGIQAKLEAKRSTHNVYVGGPFASWRLRLYAQDDVAKFIERVPVFGGKADILAAHTPGRTRFDTDLIPDPIVGIEPAGDLPCRCLMVEEDHTFTSDDLVVHNSELVSRRFPGFVLGKHPDWRIVLVSYGADLAEKMSKAAQRVVASPEYGRVFPKTKVDPAASAVSDWGVEGHDGGMMAIGVGGGITGNSADILIVDDPVKGRLEVDRDGYREEQKAWWPQAADRVQEPGGVIVLCTRWHHDDLPGYLQRLGAQDALADQWEVISLPALAEEDDPLGRMVGEPLAPGRHSLEKLLNLKANMPTRDWQAKFCQRPTPEEGSVFRRDWFKVKVLDDEPNGYIVQSWDTAFSERREADYSVGTTWRLHPAGRPTEYQLLDVVRGRWSYPELKAHVAASAARWKPRRIIVEDAASGKSLFQDLRALTALPVVGFNPRQHGDKLARAHAISALVESGRVVLQAGASWLEDYLGEVLAFPAGEHDDQVDSTTQALLVAMRQQGTERPRTSYGFDAAVRPALAGDHGLPRGVRRVLGEIHARRR